MFEALENYEFGWKMRQPTLSEKDTKTMRQSTNNKNKFEKNEIGP
jgi:hypothetical protein